MGDMMDFFMKCLKANSTHDFISIGFLFVVLLFFFFFPHRTRLIIFWRIYLVVILFLNLLRSSIQLITVKCVCVCVLFAMLLKMLHQEIANDLNWRFEKRSLQINIVPRLRMGQNSERKNNKDREQKKKKKVRYK